VGYWWMNYAVTVISVRARFGISPKRSSCVGEVLPHKYRHYLKCCGKHLLRFSLCARHAPWGTQFCSVELLLDASLNNSENLCSICLKFSAQLGFGTLNLRINLRCKTQTSKRLQCCNANTHWFHLCIARDLSFLLLTAARKVLLLFQTQEKSGSHRIDATHVL